MKKIVLAADLGGTNLRMAAVDAGGNILYRTRRATPRTESAEEIVLAIVQSAGECLQAIQKREIVKAIAVAVPATVNVEKGIVQDSPNVPSLNGFQISNVLKSQLNLPCFLENDANAAALGESWLGAAKDYKNSITVTLGTGVGGGIIIEGKILRGVDGTAGEIGHICVEPFGVTCGCGGWGCLEQYSSATAVVRLTRELGSQYPKSNLSVKTNLTSLDIYEAGQLGDELALEVFRQQGFYLGVALAGLINVLNPEVIAIGGGASAGWNLFMPHTLEQIRQRAYREPARRAKIVTALCGDAAGILGAAKLAFINMANEI
ncbi:MAG: ROK family protein [Acidobacteriota bacterium]|jgi:glucokinase|nr:ROK family protein [Acidobacteriota bacterium]MDQ3372642.1 ROK family protein [Acidobacteriota bacterium]